MRIMITGICGFVGSTLAVSLKDAGHEVSGCDSFIRPGSELNRYELGRRNIRVIHADIRNVTDLEGLSPVDWVIDAAANPSVLAGVDGKTSSRQLLEHNLWGTINVLEFCRATRAGLILLSTSRVYSIQPLASLAVEVMNDAFRPSSQSNFVAGMTQQGVDESFSTAPSLSLYGASKLASEILALEYSATFDFPVWINRCGVLAGAGQFGRADQGIFSFWINSHLRRKPLKYIGFDGMGHQVRDCLHPHDLVPVLLAQMQSNGQDKCRVQNLSGGIESSTSLAQLNHWCDARFGPHSVSSEAEPRPFDIPWMVLDSSLARRQWQWQPSYSANQIFEEIACHAEKHPDWLEISSP